MSEATIDFAELIEKDRVERAKDRWSGTFLDYLELVKQDGDLADLAHKRLYDMITGPGVDVLDTESDPRAKRVFGDRPIKVYSFFENEFFGMERTLDKIVRYFHAAAMGGEEARQVLYLMGPVGSGKSSLAEKLKRGLESLPPVYVIDGCPVFEQPLHLIPRHLRQAFEEMLDVKIEGDLCPICRHRLMNEFDGRYETMPVKAVTLSKRARRGVGVVPPVDPNNQDTSVLIGSEDISKLDRYSEGDPRVLELNGAFNVGNRGMVEFIEVFKNETEYL
ncbi:MAG: serine protein kinase, partial [Geminicoccaceae bacterium]|nr:serine protein kinase [Geminicoccaceae bacterium]